MAEVYTGRHVSSEGKFGPLVAVKRLMPHHLSNPTVVQMFLNEARITAQIDHPHVVRILDLGEVDGEPYIAMELLEGHSLADVRKEAADHAQRVPIGVTLRILADACRGLDAAHRAVDEEGRPLSIVHRDFSPENIHVGVDGWVKVIDFGIAKAARIGTATEPGTLRGKFFYMSPEMIAGEPLDYRADVYAAGAMLYEALCGRRPFTGQNADQVLDRVAEGKPRPPSEYDPSVPPALERVCLQALARQPVERFQSLLELALAMESVGGAAEVVSRENVSAYLGELFPPEQDPKRKTLREVRQADPSLPEELQDPQARKPRGAVFQTGPHPAAVASRPPQGRRWLTAVAAVAGIGMLAAVAVRTGLLRPARLSGQERLARAKGASAEDRVKLLAPLAGDEALGLREGLEAVRMVLPTDPAKAREIAASLAERFPDSKEAHMYLARSYLHLRQAKNAEAALSRASALDPKSAEPDVLLADLREAQGDVGGAVDALARAVQKRPRDLRLATRRGYLLSQSGRLDDAAKVLRGVVKRRFIPEAAAELAFVRYRQQAYSESLVLLKRALKRQPSLARGHYYLGAVLYRTGDVKGAERAYRRADALGPLDPRALTALCEMLAQRGQKASAEQVRQLLARRFKEQAPELTRSCDASPVPL